jgi:hypothetical protein
MNILLTQEAQMTYSPQEKDGILEKLVANQGDVHRTFLETGVSERTLYRWRGEFWQSWRRQSSPPSPPKSPPEFENDLQALAYLRRKIMTELISVADSFEASVNFATPTQRAKVLTQLLDRLMKLDEYLKPYQKSKIPHRILFTGDPGFYIRSQDGCRGPFSPREIPKNWKTRYGDDSRLEVHWGDDTFTLFAEEAYAELLHQLVDFEDDPTEFVEYDFNYEEEMALSYG